MFVYDTSGKQLVNLGFARTITISDAGGIWTAQAWTDRDASYYLAAWKGPDAESKAREYLFDLMRALIGLDVDAHIASEGRLYEAQEADA